MNTLEFLTHLRSLNIRLWADGAQLRYSAPAGVLTTSLKAELARRKGELLAFLNDLGAAPAADGLPLAPTPRDRPRPLSFGQERLWFLQQLNPESVAYNIPVALRLAGPLEAPALAHSLGALVRRHESLRTQFEVVDEQPVQVILPADRFAAYPLEIQDCAPEQAQACLHALAWQPFDLAHGPLLRTRLLRLGGRAQEHILFLNFHHIIFDGWSEAIFYRELAEGYAACLEGRPAELPALPVQYADFAQWEREEFAQHGRPGLDYWREHLRGELPNLDLPTYQARPALQRYHGAACKFRLPAALVEALKAFSRAQNATLFMTLMAAFEALLGRYSGQTDMVVGVPAANRLRPEVENLVGFFVSTLALRADLSGSPTFETLLARVRDEALAAFAHQATPFEQVVEAACPGRDPSRQPLFQVMFAWESTPAVLPYLRGLQVSALKLENPTAKFDLTLEMAESEGTVGGALEYNTDLFTARQASAMLGHFQTLLEGAVADPAQRVAHLPLLTAPEREQILVAWNATETRYPGQDMSLPEWFEAQAERTPERVAVAAEDRRLTYAELNARANQLARYLQARGISPGALVGTCVEPSLDMAIGLLGILKAGGVYVPLDPAYPDERLAYLQEDAQLTLLLTHKRLADRLPGLGPKAVCLDLVQDAVAAQSEANLGLRRGRDSLLYVIYTSGSTGQPKGAAVYERSFVNLLHWFITEFGLTAQDRVLLISSLSFDLTQKNIFSPLLVGGTLHLLPLEVYDPCQIVKAAAARQITWLNCTPSAFYPLIDQGEDSLRLADTLRYVFLGGEPISMPRITGWLKATGNNVEVVNTYGPTECADICAAYRVKEPELFNERPVPIGKAIPNARLYILDSEQEPAPVGKAGELYVGGAGVGPGYLRHPDLTAAKFMPDPFTSQPGAQLYRTGDLVRHQPDGNIEFLERVDHQVKLRGFRIELGEIEAALGQMAAVREAVVLARDDMSAERDKRLVAYVVPREGQTVTAGDLRRHLKARLPAYMAPAAFVVLEALPLSPNGKVDRQALPKPDKLPPGMAEPYLAPRTSVEELLAQLWAGVLGVERVGVHDNFFELGGHSLQITRIMLQIKRIFRVELSFRDFFKTATVASLARAIQVGRRPEAGREAAAPGMAAWSDEFASDLALDPAIRPAAAPAAPPSPPQSVFFTGATGFLGAYLLGEILKQTPAVVHCLVRAPSPEAALLKLQKNLEFYQLWEAPFAGRLRPVLGDLSQVNLGLPMPQFEALAGQIDAVFHDGAVVNFVYPYAELRAVNVLGTQTVLRLAAGRAVPIHYISTLSVFDAAEVFDGRRIYETDELPGCQSLFNGYAQSKWVAEKLVWAARRRGLPVVIYRPGLVAGDSRTGIWKTGDYFTRLVRGCVELGWAPDLDEAWHLTPVDYVSRAIVQLASQPASRGRAFHLTTAASLTTQQVAAWLQRCRYPVQQMAYAAWRTMLINQAAHNTQNALYPLLPLFLETLAEGGTMPEMYLPGKEPCYDDREAAAALAPAGLACPEVDEALLARYLDYFVRSGFLPAPPGGPG